MIEHNATQRIPLYRIVRALTIPHRTGVARIARLASDAAGVLHIITHTSYAFSIKSTGIEARINAQVDVEKITELRNRLRATDALTVYVNQVADYLLFGWNESESFTLGLRRGDTYPSPALGVFLRGPLYEFVLPAWEWYRCTESVPIKARDVLELCTSDGMLRIYLRGRRLDSPVKAQNEVQIHTSHDRQLHTFVSARCFDAIIRDLDVNAVVLQSRRPSDPLMPLLMRAPDGRDTHALAPMASAESGETKAHQ